MANRTSDFERLIFRLTDTRTSGFDYASMQELIQKVKTVPKGPQDVCQILVRKLHLSDSEVGMKALTVLEKLVQQKDNHVLDEIGKFRFLNELIRLISPKYAGNETSDKVKEKIRQLIVSWAKELSDYPKIQEAYQMLKKEGIISEEHLEASGSSTVPKTKSVFEDEEKTIVLRALLRSKNRDDLQTANWLIKSLVKEEDEKMERSRSRLEALESARRAAVVLSEMLTNYSPGTNADEDLLKELYDTCEKNRSSLYRFAVEGDTESNVAEVLETNDMITDVLNDYRQVFKCDTSEDTVNREGGQKVSIVSSNVLIDTTDPVKKLNDTDEVSTKKSNKDELLEAFSGGFCSSLPEPLLPSQRTPIIPPIAPKTWPQGLKSQFLASSILTPKPDSQNSQVASTSKLRDFETLTKDMLMKNLGAFEKNQEKNLSKVTLNDLKKIRQVEDCKQLIEKSKEGTDMKNSEIGCPITKSGDVVDLLS